MCVCQMGTPYVCKEGTSWGRGTVPPDLLVWTWHSRSNQLRFLIFLFAHMKLASGTSLPILLLPSS